ncbi:MAG: NADP-dependent isocitrate dehydrogenase [Oscillospiraceae bacterium]|jgi:isocitrate dehydrogenase|nr:NADP-dependent isocitrate dehydrogenase [Oscillospiraceae bacterium]
MPKIQMKTPLVEIDGDEMTRVLWSMIKDALITPFVELKTEYYDLGLPHRNATQDAVTLDAAAAIKKYGVSVKCATITPNAQRMREFPELTKMWRSPNVTIRAALDGIVFRAPIVIACIQPAVRSWRAPIIIARHAYGDIYSAAELYADEPGEAKLVFTGDSGKTRETPMPRVDSPSVWLGMHNKDSSIRGFARACFGYAASEKLDLWFSAKDTIASTYDGRFRDIFEEEYETGFRDTFEKLGITYFYTLIDDAAARVMRSPGGFVWALQNYEGDIFSDMISSAFGTLALMTSVLVSPDGCFAYEAAHGTVTKHFYKYLAGEETSTNPTATIFAWAGALKKRGELDGLDELAAFGEKLGAACVSVISGGVMTRDLAPLTDGSVPVQTVNTREFLDAVQAKLT